MAEPAVGAMGVATAEVTQVAGHGRVRIGLSTFEATTSEAPIPVGDLIVVDGWQRFPTGLVLFVRRSSEVPGRPTEDSMAELERRLSALEKPQPSGGVVGTLLLTFGQIVSAAGCAAFVVWCAMTLEKVGFALTVLATATVGFLYSAAMFVVFGRVKQVPPR